VIEAVRPGATILDLQVIRPNPPVEADDTFVCEIDREPLYRHADAATAAVDTAISQGQLLEEAVDDHDVRKHDENGPDVVDDFEDKERKLPPAAIPKLLEIARPCLVRERCRLRCLARLV
jgi:hypothetical protein